MPLTTMISSSPAQGLLWRLKCLLQISEKRQSTGSVMSLESAAILSELHSLDIHVLESLLAPMERMCFSAFDSVAYPAPVKQEMVVTDHTQILPA